MINFIIFPDSTKKNFELLQFYDYKLIINIKTTVLLFEKQ